MAERRRKVGLDLAAGTLELLSECCGVIMIVVVGLTVMFVSYLLWPAGGRRAAVFFGVLAGIAVFGLHYLFDHLALRLSVAAGRPERPRDTAAETKAHAFAPKAERP